MLSIATWVPVIPLFLSGCWSNTDADLDTNTNTEGDDDYGYDDGDCPSAPLVVGQPREESPIDCTGVGEAVFATDVLHRVDIDLAAADWEAIEAEAAAIAEDECRPPTYFEAGLQVDDLPALDGVGVRVKGNYSLAIAAEYGWSLPLKLDINRFEPGQNLDGLKKLNLHAIVKEGGGGTQWEWPSDPVAEFVSYNTMLAHGVPASRASLAEVFVNGESQGLYSMVEQVDGRFVRCNFPAPFGDLYKPDHDLSYEAGDPIEDYGDLNFKWPETSDHQAARGLLDALNFGSGGELEEALDVDSALTYFALNIGLGNWDYYTFIPHNYYIYEATPSRFTVIPWDMNMSQVDWVEPCGFGAGEEDEMPLSRRLLGDPDYVERYVPILRAFLEGGGSVQAQHQLIDDIEPLVSPWVGAERLDRLRENIATRVPGMLANLEGLNVCPDWTDEDP